MPTHGEGEDDAGESDDDNSGDSDNDNTGTTEHTLLVEPPAQTTSTAQNLIDMVNAAETTPSRPFTKVLNRASATNRLRFLYDQNDTHMPTSLAKLYDVSREASYLADEPMLSKPFVLPRGHE